MSSPPEIISPRAREINLNTAIGGTDPSTQLVVSPRSAATPSSGGVDQLTSEKRQAFIEKQRKDEQVYGTLLRSKLNLRKCGRDRKRKDVVYYIHSAIKEYITASFNDCACYHRY
jgi:hypothetical protein